jgi:hypothetical protein
MDAGALGVFLEELSASLRGPRDFDGGAGAKRGYLAVCALANMSSDGGK